MKASNAVASRADFRRRRFLRVGTAVAATMTINSAVFGQLSLSGTSYVQTFDQLSVGLPTGWTVRTGASSVSLGGAANFATAPVSWGATTGQFENVASSNGLTETATTAQQAASTDRALGIRQSAAFGDPGAAFTLQLGNTLGRTGFSASFDAEMLSVQTRSTVWKLQYGLGIFPQTFTDLATYNDPGSFGSMTINADPTALAGIENKGQNVWLRVVALDPSTGTGSRDTFGINNFRLNWTGTGPSGAGTVQYWDLNGTAAGIGGAGPATLDTTSQNFNSSSLGTGTQGAYNANSITAFGGTAGTVNIDPAGITENGGIQFLSSGYTIAAGGGSLTLGVDSSITVTNATDTATINAGITGTQGLVKNGAGTLVLGGVNNHTGGTVINAGKLKVMADSALGDPSSQLILNGGTLLTGADLTLTRQTITGLTSTIDTNGFKVDLATPVIGASTLVKAGAGTLVLSSAGASGNFVGGVTINGGTVQVTYSDATLVPAGSVSVAGNTTGLGQGVTNINSGGTLEIKNVAVGNGQTATGPQINLNNGGVLAVTGPSASYGRSGGALTIANGTAASPNTVTLLTTTADTVFTMGSSLRQLNTASNTFATINVNGPGRVVLQSGGTTASTGFVGNWVLNSGILQVGPVNPGGFGEPLNGLGTKAGTQTFGNPVTVNSGAVLAVATNQANGQTSGSDFPTSLRALITLAGGTLAAIVDPTGVGAGSLDEGNNNGAQFSGNLTIKAGTPSTILLADPLNAATKHNVLLNTALSVPGSITWEAGATLNVTGGGVFSLVRTIDYIPTGTTPVTVGAGASLNVGTTSTVQLGGSMDALGNTTTGTYVNVANSGTFTVINDSGPSVLSGSGPKTMGNLTGTGKTILNDSTSLTAGRIVQSSLTLNGSATAAIRKGVNNAASGLSVVGSLTIGSGTLDLNNNDLVLTATPLSTVQAAVNSAAANGAFTGGSGITSSVAKTIFADAGQAHKTGLGYATASSVGINSVDATGVNPTDVIVKYTLIGDANLDGKVNALDFNALATSYGSTSSTWSKGDVTYDGITNTADFTALSQNFNASLPAAPAPALGALVPEPMSMGLIGCAGLALVRRRRRD